MYNINKFGMFIVYTLLICGAILFIGPLVWMVSTSFKPLEQAMSTPPRWLPYMNYVVVDDIKKPVVKEAEITKPSYIIKTENGDRYIIQQNQIENSYWIRTDVKGNKTKLPVEILETINASKNNTYLKIRDYVETKEINTTKILPWYVVPEDEFRTKIDFKWNNYSAAIKEMKYFWNYIGNTLVICFLGCLGTVVSSALVAYGFAKIEWPGRDKVFIIVLSTMMIPFAVTMVPLYGLFRNLGLVGTLQPLWITAWFGGAFNIFLLRQFFMTIPKDLSEAAKIDGCSEFKIFTTIIVPMSKPALLVVALFHFMYAWSKDFLGPLIYLTDQKQYTMALGLQLFQSQTAESAWNYLMAASVIMLVPVIILFFFTQKQFIEGIATTGFKG